MAGHAAAAEGSTLAMALDGLHLLATGVWAGGLVPLALCLTWARRLSNSAAAAKAAERFSRLALGAVTILAVTGAYAAWQQVGGVPAFVGTAYGRWLLLKLVLFGALLPLAARNLLVWRRRLAAPGPGTAEAVAALRGDVLLETALVAAILLVVAVMGLTTRDSTTRSRGPCRSGSTGRPPRRFPGSSLASRSEARWRPSDWWHCCWRW